MKRVLSITTEEGKWYAVAGTRDQDTVRKISAELAVAGIAGAFEGNRGGCTLGVPKKEISKVLDLIRIQNLALRHAAKEEIAVFDPPRALTQLE